MSSYNDSYSLHNNNTVVVIGCYEPFHFVFNLRVCLFILKMYTVLLYNSEQKTAQYIRKLLPICWSMFIFSISSETWASWYSLSQRSKRLWPKTALLSSNWQISNNWPWQSEIRKMKVQFYFVFKECIVW